MAGLRNYGRSCRDREPSGLPPAPRCPSWAPARRALVWPGGTWSREAARASARTQLTRSPTAAHVQPDPPAGRQPSGGRHLRRPAPGTSRRETSCVTGRVLLTPARARLMAACRPAVPRSAYAPSGGPLLANPTACWEASSQPRDEASAVSRAVLRAPGDPAGHAGRDTPWGDPSRVAARVLRTGCAALDWQQTAARTESRGQRSGGVPQPSPEERGGRPPAKRYAPELLADVPRTHRQKDLTT